MDIIKRDWKMPNLTWHLVDIKSKRIKSTFYGMYYQAVEYFKDSPLYDPKRQKIISRSERSGF